MLINFRWQNGAGHTQSSREQSQNSLIIKHEQAAAAVATSTHSLSLSTLNAQFYNSKVKLKNFHPLDFSYSEFPLAFLILSFSFEKHWSITPNIFCSPPDKASHTCRYRYTHLIWLLCVIKYLKFAVNIYDEPACASVVHARERAAGRMLINYTAKPSTRRCSLHKFQVIKCFHCRSRQAREE